jgi:SPP1 family predicted phage head-tail adaptor
MSQGKKSRLLLIQRNVGARDALNQPVPSWITHVQRWGEFRGDTGRSAIRAQEVGVPISTVRVSWRINYSPNAGITEGMRVNARGVLYDIRSIRHDEGERKFTDLICEQGGNNG